MYEKKIAELVKQLEDEHAHFEGAEEQLDLAKRLLSDHQNSIQVTLLSLNKKLGYMESYMFTPHMFDFMFNFSSIIVLVIIRTMKTFFFLLHPLLEQVFDCLK
jgi:hypothetical protein